MTEFAAHDPKHNNLTETMSQIAGLISLDARRRRGESYDFSEHPEDAIELMMTTLRHPSANIFHGDRLAQYIEFQLNGSHEASAESYSKALNEIIATGAETDDDIFDRKITNDAVFRLLVGALKETSGSSDQLKSQRKATRSLLSLRASIAADKTADDETWVDVVGRLYS